MSKTAAAIRVDLNALDDRLLALQQQTETLSLDAINDVGDARAELAATLREIDALTGDRSILSIGLEQAQQAERKAERIVDAADRERHIREARSAAGRLLAAGQQADEMIGRFLDLVADMNEVEQSLHRSLRAAGQPVSAGIHGAYGAASIASDKMAAGATGKLRMLADQRSLAEILSSAWRDLIPENEHD